MPLSKMKEKICQFYCYRNTREQNKLTNEKMDKLELVIFDMDGVLADTGPIHFESWVKMAAEIGMEFTKDMFEQTFGQQSNTITRKLVGPEVDNSLVEYWGNLKEQYYREM